MSLLLDNQKAFLLNVADLISHVYRINLSCTAGELWRPQEMQELYLQQGKTHAHSSLHTARLAIDLNIFNLDGTLSSLEQISPLGVYWESLNPMNRWGGHFTTLKDGPHFERNVPGQSS